MWDSRARRGRGYRLIQHWHWAGQSLTDSLPGHGAPLSLGLSAGHSSLQNLPGPFTHPSPWLPPGLTQEKVLGELGQFCFHSWLPAAKGCSLSRQTWVRSRAGLLVRTVAHVQNEQRSKAKKRQSCVWASLLSPKQG